MLLRSQLVREIRRHKPDVILCIDPYRSNSHTHRDHRMSGQVALDAAFTYAWSHLHFPEQIDAEGLEPHRVAEAYLWGSETPDVFVDVADYLDLKAESLGKHASQMSGRDQSARAHRVRERAAMHAEATGLPFTEAFRRIRFELGSMASQFMNS
jgi:LmbE family N-acetylglucosaminyl deacetylase